jgi:hypothetical protein
MAQGHISLSSAPAQRSFSHCPVDPSAIVASYCACLALDPARATTTPHKNRTERALEPTGSAPELRAKATAKHRTTLMPSWRRHY